MDNLLSNALGQDAGQVSVEEKRNLLSRLLARLAHEIRNPLSSLDIHVQLLEEDLAQLAPATRKQLSGRLDIIHGELHRLENIVKHFLRLAKPSALETEPVQITTIVKHVCDLLRPEAAAREIAIELQLDEILPPVMADPVQITQALLNLVINSVQAIGRKGEITLRLSSQSDSITIEVHDTGPGIPAEKQAAIFEPYFTTKDEGSGLGLWIAQQIATAHGGSLTTANAPSGGAIFTLLVPLPRKDS
jgi:signal transduction histidine kinase